MKTPSHAHLSVISVIDLISADRNEEVMKILKELKQGSAKIFHNVRNANGKTS